MVIVAFQGKQIETPDPASSIRSWIFKQEAEFHLYTDTEIREENFIVTVSGVSGLNVTELFGVVSQSQSQSQSILV